MIQRERSDSVNPASVIMGRMSREDLAIGEAADSARPTPAKAPTLYCRFPTRSELIACAFASKMQDYADATETALAHDDAWEGFCWYIERLCQMQADDHGFTDVLTMTFPMSPQFQEIRDRVFVRFSMLVTRAKKAGHLRKDFSTEDLPLILMANAGVITATGGAAPNTWKRLIQLLLQELQAPARGPLPRPPTPEEMHKAMLRS
jgi:hypothetical protein